ncbi:MAG: hypothetical protein EA381_11780 [Planctomycetaceae bacterium]|nr:MAG: hypothetical protein EA381_11780 [Planctomycetaceae bacterium]
MAIAGHFYTRRLGDTERGFRRGDGEGLARSREVAKKKGGTVFWATEGTEITERGFIGEFGSEPGGRYISAGVR